MTAKLNSYLCNVCLSFYSQNKMKGMKTGGRQKGTPNKDNPLKGYLRTHSEEYFKPKPQVDSEGHPIEIVFSSKDGGTTRKISLADSEGNPYVMSDFDVDMLKMEPDERVNAELRLLEFHTPKMKSVDVDMSVQESKTIEDRLLELSRDDDEEDE